MCPGGISGRSKKDFGKYNFLAPSPPEMGERVMTVFLSS